MHTKWETTELTCLITATFFMNSSRCSSGIAFPGTINKLYHSKGQVTNMQWLMMLSINAELLSERYETKCQSAQITEGWTSNDDTF